MPPFGLRGILFDLDGVIYNAEQPIAGAAETVAWARQRRIPYLFVTNTTSRPRAALTAKLARLGIAAAPTDEILTPAAAAVEWLRSQAPGKLALFLKPEAQGEFAALPQIDADAETGAEYVVIGDLGSDWTYATLNRAFRLLHHNQRAVLLALGMTRFWQAPGGISLDVAPFVAALEHATGRQAVVLGKPAAPFFQAAAARLNLSPEQLLMIGDDVVGDIGGAQRAGLRGGLVKTGKYRPHDAEGEIHPDALLDSVAALPAWWES
jgi:HAD superfamily hydrolase (TIGR01458 family)